MNQDPRLLEALFDRRSTPPKCLAAPAPDDETLQRILQAAESAPDHGGLHPWRFLVIRGPALDRLGEVFVEAYRQRVPDATDAACERERERALRPPLIVAAIARTEPGHEKIPEIEQLLSAGIATHQVVLATEALGFGVVWLTGPRAYDPQVMRALGLDENETLIGLINIGSRTEDAPKSPRKRGTATLEFWTGPRD
ncbi:MAG: nitroreductase [Guyparkeria sp.]|uniref:nitroreductase family protein n=1 Tax=Guyparkeria sp. TaxID=2035736 RepID=UPI00397C8AE5